MTVEEGLPTELQGPATTITRISAGLSGAGVYRVDADGQTFVLKISSANEPIEDWRRKVNTLRLAASAGVAPRVRHVDEARRAVVSAFVADRSFPARFMNPATREAALVQLGHTVRRVHELPLPPEMKFAEPRDFLASIWSELDGPFSLPTFVGDAVRRVLDEEPPASERALVLSHNDVNPSNLVYDGENLLLVDWDATGANDPLYDLATISVFLRMDDETCLRLLSAHDDKAIASLPERFVYSRPVIAVMCGVSILNVARKSGYVPATDAATLDTTPTLVEFYQGMRTGAFNIATPDGQWWFGLALVKTGLTLARSVRPGSAQVG